MYWCSSCSVSLFLKPLIVVLGERVVCGASLYLSMALGQFLVYGHCIQMFDLVLCFVMLGIEIRVLSMPGKYSTTIESISTLIIIF